MKVTGYSKVLINILFLIASFFIGAIVIEFREPLTRIVMGITLDVVIPILIGLSSIFIILVIGWCVLHLLFDVNLDEG